MHSLGLQMFYLIRVKRRFTVSVQFESISSFLVYKQVFGLLHKQIGLALTSHFNPNFKPQNTVTVKLFLNRFALFAVLRQSTFILCSIRVCRPFYTL